MASSHELAPRRETRPRPDADTSPTKSILKVTEELLGSTSLKDLTVAAIIKEAGVSRGTFYFYFTSKYSVLAALLGRIVTEISEATRAYTARGDAPPADGLRRMMETIVAIYARHQAVLRAASENWHADRELEEMYETMTARIVGELAEHIGRDRDAGRAPLTVEPEALAAALTWMNERTLYAAASEIDPVLHLDETLVATLTTVWTGSIYGSPSPD